jgi:sec-independent protein translocase protein TatB
VGFSLGEILLLVLVGIIVVGPKRLPGLMRTAGHWVARLRRMSMDLRSQSGIDDILRQEGLDQHLHELRSLSRLNVVETLITQAPGTPPILADAPGATGARAERPKLRQNGALVPREPARAREYPLVGCDAYGALPDDAAMYVETAPPKRVESYPTITIEESSLDDDVPPSDPEPAEAPEART